MKKGVSVSMWTHYVHIHTKLTFMHLLAINYFRANLPYSNLWLSALLRCTTMAARIWTHSFPATNRFFNCCTTTAQRWNPSVCMQVCCAYSNVCVVLHASPCIPKIPFFSQWKMWRYSRPVKSERAWKRGRDGMGTNHDCRFASGATTTNAN